MEKSSDRLKGKAIYSEAEQAVDLATELLEICMDLDLSANTVQAGLGNAWFRLCLGMRFTPEQFRGMAIEMANQFEKL